MAHFTKFTVGAVGHMTGHYDRTKKNLGENIDKSRTQLNYNLAPQRNDGQVNFIRQRLSEVKHQNRADVKVMCDWVVTLPQGDYTPEQEKAFFKTAYSFLTERYGEQNTVSAYVHMDEKQPHLHYAFIPVVQDKKHPGREKVSAKECVTRRDLQSFHLDLQKRMDKRFEEDLFPVLNGATIGGNMAITEMRAENAIESLQYDISEAHVNAEEAIRKAQHEASEAQYRVQDIKRDIKQLEDKRNDLVEDVEIAEANFQNKKISCENSLKVMESAVEKAYQKGVQTFGINDWNQRIKESRLQAHTENRLTLLEKFVSLPQIAPLFKEFLRIIDHGRNRPGHTKDGPER